jgi:hypothetical protein
MNHPARRNADMTAEAQMRRCRYLDLELAFCRSALFRGNAYAAHGELDSASRDAWLVEDTAPVIRRVLAKVKDSERLNRYRSELNYVQRGLNDLRTSLGIPGDLD